jgi:hypothetical protein
MSDPARTTPLHLRTEPGTPGSRLRLKPGLARTGAVDGGWWPASWDLPAEIPGLVAAFPAAAGEVWRVGFGRSRWDVVPPRTRGWADGKRIGLDGFAAFAANVVWVVTSITGNAPLFLVVVPPDTAPDVAADVLARAGAADNLEGPADLLADCRPPTSATTPAEPALAASHG